MKLLSKLGKLSILRKWDFLYWQPKSIRLEASSYCQLRCPECVTGRKELAFLDIGQGRLTFTNFRNLVEESPHLVEFELSNWGEIFLNPELLKIMEFSHTHGKRLYASNGVNLNSASESVLEGLVLYQFRHLTCSIDGNSNETYIKYRVRGNVEKVFSNIAKINAFKLRYRTPYPTLSWQFIVFPHNVHEIGAARKHAEQLGMTFRTKLAYGSFRFTQEQKLEIAKETDLPFASISDQLENTAIWGEGICSQLWTDPQVNFDGKMLGCCMNHWSSFGNIFEFGLKGVLLGEKMRYARRMLLGTVSERQDIPCTSCGIFQSRKQLNRWVSEIEITKATFRKNMRIVCESVYLKGKSLLFSLQSRLSNVWSILSFGGASKADS